MSKKISCIIIEDQAPAQRILKRYIGDTPVLELKNSFADALSALEYLKTNPIDLIFLDIHLPKISGMDFLKILNPVPSVILTTAFSEYALDGYEYEVTDYLLKPFSLERFTAAVQKVERSFATENKEVHKSKNTKLEDFIFVKSGHDFIKIAPTEIRYIKSEGDYTRIVLAKEKHLVSETLKDWQKQLPEPFFYQIHKSYLVNIAFISKISGNQVFVESEILPVGRTYKERFFEDFLKK